MVTKIEGNHYVLWEGNFFAADFISHSMSREQLKFIFCDLLPDLSGKNVLDIGSRMGPVLYAVSVLCGV